MNLPWSHLQRDVEVLSATRWIGSCCFCSLLLAAIVVAPPAAVMLLLLLLLQLPLLL